MATKILRDLAAKPGLVNPPARAARVVKTKATPTTIQQTHIVRQVKPR